MELSEVDLNLLVVFEQLLKHGRVSTAARSLGLSQPAVSNALARLRVQFGDELFVRTARGMSPTPFAIEFASAIGDAMTSIRDAINQHGSFTPDTSDRRFVLSLSDLGEIYFLPSMMHALTHDAPGIQISTVWNAASTLAEEMESGRIDLAIGHLPDLMTGFFQQRLFAQRYVCMFRQGHRLAKARVSVKDFSSAEHVVVVSAGTGHSRADEFLARSGVLRRVKLEVPHFVAVADILAKTDLIATVPEKFAERSAAYFGLAYVAHPVAIPDIQINLLWHRRYHRDPANTWLRTRLFDHFTE